MSKLLQTVYAAQLAETAFHYSKYGILKEIEESKREYQLKNGAMKASQMGINFKEEVFTKLRDLFGCANWVVDNEKKIAKATGCMLCSIAKKMGSEKPCNLYCLDPMEGMVKGLNSKSKFDVKTTLWESNECYVDFSEQDFFSCSKNLSI